MKLKNKILQRGFTLVELLITIAIIGILAAIVLVNLNSSRSDSRDVRRLADIREIMTALQLYYNDNGGYPGPVVASTSGPTPDDGDPDWSTYLGFWPPAPEPFDNEPGLIVCDATNNLYTYTQLNAGNDFSVTFCLGQQVREYGPGLHTASDSGLQ